MPTPATGFILSRGAAQGSSAIAAMLAALPEVFVPGFEPLDAPGLSPAQKLAFMEAAFTFPATPTAFAAWRRELLPAPHIRVNRTLVRDFGQLEGKTVAGFKLRPYAGAGNQSHTAMTGGREPLLLPAIWKKSSDCVRWPGRPAGWLAGWEAEVLPCSRACSFSCGNATLRPALFPSGLDPAAVRALLRRYNVSLLLTLRRNRVKEALSWYKARELGLRWAAAELELAFLAREFFLSSAPGVLGSSAVSAGHERGLAQKCTNTEMLMSLVGRQFNAVKAQRHLGVPQLLQGPAAPGPQPPQHPPAGPVAVNVTALLGWLAYVDWVNGALLNATVAFQRPKLTIFYEDFLADPLSVVAEAAR